MKRLALIAAALALVAAHMTSSALAKGASKATITGPGLGEGITLPGEGQVGGEQLMELADQAGFFAAVFATYPTPIQTERPAGTLGPRYTIAYTMPGPNNELDVIRQTLYPYARPDPVTYMEPGQGFYGDQETVGGWYVASSSLREALVLAGLPESAPSTDGGGSQLPWVILGALAATAIAAAVGAAVLLSRRPRPAPAATAASMISTSSSRR